MALPEPPRTIQSQDIDDLIQLFESSDWDEMYLKIEGFEVFLSTDPSGKEPEALGSAVRPKES